MTTSFATLLPPAYHKYWVIFVMSWQNSFVYRTNLLMWRFRQFLSTLMAMTIWNVIFTSQSQAFGYSYSQMVSYILLVSLLQSLILATSLHGLAGEIYSGQIIHHLLKPQKLFLSFATVEIADKLKNILFGLTESALLLLIFQPQLVWPSFDRWVVFLLMAGFGILIHFYITLWFGTLGFWTPDVWAPKFVFFILLEFTAGKLFPLDILPKFIQNMLFLTPFPYLSYVQIQYWLGRVEPTQLWQFWTGLIIWTFLSWWLAQRWWQHGIKNFEATGQ